MERDIKKAMIALASPGHGRQNGYLPPPGNWVQNQMFLEKPEVGCLIPIN